MESVRAAAAVIHRYETSRFTGAVLEARLEAGRLCNRSQVCHVILALALCSSLLNSAAADAKAEQIASAMTPDERLQLVNGEAGTPVRNGVRTGAIGSAGYVPGVSRLGVPALQETDAGLGIANPNGVRRRDIATAMPSALSLASTWDPQLAYQYGATIGDEAWRKGFNYGTIVVDLERRQVVVATAGKLSRSTG